MERGLVVFSCIALVFAGACAPSVQPFRLGPSEVVPPVAVAEAERYVDGRCIGLTLVDARGDEILLTVVSNAGPPGDGSAYRPITVPCGAVLVGTLHAATGTGELLPGGGSWEQDLIRTLRAHLRRLPRSGRDSAEASLVKEAVVLLEHGCEPSN